MAFNPSPKVAHARDYASKFSKTHVIILSFNFETGEIEYASYGTTKDRCDQAEVLAEAAYNALVEYLKR